MISRQDTATLLSVGLPPDPPVFSEAQAVFRDPFADPTDSLPIRPLDSQSRQLPDVSFNYETEFQALIQDHTLTVAEVDTAELDALSHDKHAEDMKEEEREWLDRRDRLWDVWALEKEGKWNMKEDFKVKRKKLKQKVKLAGKETKEREKLIDKTFDAAISQLQSVIKERRQEVKVHMGALKDKSTKYLKSESTWNRQHALELRFEVVRCVKDKLPCGYYVLFVSIWDRQGGNPLEYSKEQRITVPKRHGGRYYQQSLKIEQSLTFRIPSLGELRPNMVLSFELFLLATGGVADKVMAHAFFPICNSDFTPIEGKFKIPMIRGEVNTNWDKFRDLEALYCKDLDQWIGNLYFQISRPENVAARQLALAAAPRPDGQEPELYPELRSPDQFDEYRTSVTSPDGLKFRSSNYKKFLYMLSELMSDLGFRTLRRADMYLTLSILALVCWVGRFFHYVAQWLYILGIGVEVVDFKALYATLHFRYASDTSFGVEFGVTAIGPSALILLFVLLSGLAVLVNKVMHWYPKIAYRLTMACGLIACFDWLFVLIESLCFGYISDDWEGDSFKLYRYFERTVSRPAMGGVITAMLYVFLSGLAMFLLYIYLLYIHLGGRMLDVYTRLTAPETKFFVPMDSEVSEGYLEWVCAKAHQFSNAQGHSRRIVVGEYQLSDVNNEHNTQVLSHVAIYTEQEGGKKQLYRHFVRMTDGAICELSSDSNRMNGLEDHAP